MEKPFKTISSKIAWAYNWYNVRQDKIQLPDGSLGQYNVVQKPPAVWILPITPNKEFVLIHQYQY